MTTIFYELTKENNNPTAWHM